MPELRKPSEARATLPHLAPLASLGPGAAAGRRLLCRDCGAPVTDDGAAVPVAGSAVHHRTNPSGIAFTFGCFGAAPGARIAGEPTAEHTWFPGYAWSFALCRGCGEQLGWHFRGRLPHFYGLILTRLRLESSDPGPPM
ncbi:MAG: hypothetical protein HZB55_04995 [Deltaproteobacteria bacterium]|nr:hypothetical protein [Deltaproteobacteria bacterium]